METRLVKKLLKSWAKYAYSSESLPKLGGAQWQLEPTFQKLRIRLRIIFFDQYQAAARLKKTFDALIDPHFHPLGLGLYAEGCIAGPKKFQEPLLGLGRFFLPVEMKQMESWLFGLFFLIMRKINLWWINST